ncbi:MAG TPA: aminotransferase class III-fold pyridoxal phosphate-dependent enzyme [Hyphomicrobiaceae bacterium]|nr:aminotransferase class III-fold pyridoxal phosphate-dependent enzyme [Hyphomicrobiaceae bacterium]
MTQMQRSAAEIELAERARKVLPAGTFGNTALDIVIARGKGGHVWDVSGNEYIDYLLGSGPMLVGHCHPKVEAAVLEQVPLGTTFFVNNPHGIQLAEEIVAAVPCAEQVRFVSSGSEADLYAMRVARAYKRRDKILKFEGGYHGMSDYGLMSLAPKRLANFPAPVPDSAGIPKSLREEVLVAPFNDLAAVEGLVSQHGKEIAAIIVEPFQRLIPPKPGFLEGLRKITEQNGIVLIFDEVVTGFRFAYGGAQAYYGVTPDLATFGKVIGGGFPLAAIAGKADIMRHFDKAAVGEEDFTVQIGTLSGNPVASAAGLATMQILKEPGAYDKIFATGRALMDGISERIRAAKLPAQVIGEPPLFDVIFAEGDIHDYRGTLRSDAKMQGAVNRSLLGSGILKGDSKYYLSLAHTEADVAKTLDAWDEAIRALKGAKAA